MTASVQFRRYEEADTDALLALDEWALRDAGTDPADVPGSEDLGSVQEAYLDAGGDFIVGTVTPGDLDGAAARTPPQVGDRRLVAMGGYLPTEAGYDDERSVRGAAELHRMRVAPTHQGRGYGRVLLAELEARAVDAGFELLLATTATRQRRAVAFYPAAGYREVGRSEHGGYELVHYEKRICC